MLCESLEEECERYGSAELRTKYLAFSTDFIRDYSFGSHEDLLHDHEQALKWRDTIAALAFYTPYTKQMSWVLPILKCLPPWVVSCFSPGLGRQLGVFRVSAFAKGLQVMASADDDYLS